MLRYMAGSPVAIGWRLRSINIIFLINIVVFP